MKISELSRATGVDVDTIRYYEKSGLLPPPARQANGYRHYGDAHLERLAFVRHCRALDMPLPTCAACSAWSTASPIPTAPRMPSWPSSSSGCGRG